MTETFPKTLTLHQFITAIYLKSTSIVVEEFRDLAQEIISLENPVLDKIFIEIPRAKYLDCEYWYCCTDTRAPYYEVCGPQLSEQFLKKHDVSHYKYQQLVWHNGTVENRNHIYKYPQYIDILSGILDSIDISWRIPNSRYFSKSLFRKNPDPPIEYACILTTINEQPEWMWALDASEWMNYDAFNVKSSDVDVGFQVLPCPSKGTVLVRILEGEKAYRAVYDYLDTYPEPDRTDPDSPYKHIDPQSVPYPDENTGLKWRKLMLPGRQYEADSDLFFRKEDFDLPGAEEHALRLLPTFRRR